MAMEGTTLRRKARFYDESGRRHEKCQQPVQDQSLVMEKSWVMMTHNTKTIEEARTKPTKD